MTAWLLPEAKRRSRAARRPGVGEGGVSGDEARVAAHELDEADTIVGAKRLGVGGADGGNGGGHGGLKPEGAANEVEVVVDGLRNADDGNLQATATALVGDVAGTTEGAIAANREEDVDAHALKGVNHADGVLLAARGTEKRAAPLVDGVNLVRRENHGLVAELGDEAGVAITEAVDGLDAVAEGQDLDQALDDVVQTRAEAAGGNDGGAGGAGIMENLAMGAGALKLGGRPILLDELLNVAGTHAQQGVHIVLFHEVRVLDRRINLALTKILGDESKLGGVVENTLE